MRLGIFSRLTSRFSIKNGTFASAYARRDARVAEEARLESVYTSKAYPGFESRSLRYLMKRGPYGFPFFVPELVSDKVNYRNILLLFRQK